jgi:hypothetical protein
MRHARAVLLAAAALLAGCGRPLLAAELSVPSVRITSATERIDPGTAPIDVCALLDCVVTQVQYDVGGEVPFVNEPGVTIDLRLTDFALHLSPVAPGNLDGLEFVRLVALAPGSGAETAIASYEKPPGAAMPAEILVSGKSTVELAPFLGDGRVDAHLEFGFSSLPGAFDYYTDAEFSVNVIFEYDAFL